MSYRESVSVFDRSSTNIYDNIKSLEIMVSHFFAHIFVAFFFHPSVSNFGNPKSHKLRAHYALLQLALRRRKMMLTLFIDLELLNFNGCHKSAKIFSKESVRTSMTFACNCSSFRDIYEWWPTYSGVWNIKSRQLRARKVTEAPCSLIFLF